jgi:hypothetical protein
MSAYIETAWPCQQNLNIREIQATPVALIRFPLQIVSSPRPLPCDERTFLSGIPCSNSVKLTNVAIDWAELRVSIDMPRHRTGGDQYPPCMAGGKVRTLPGEEKACAPI